MTRPGNPPTPEPPTPEPPALGRGAAEPGAAEPVARPGGHTVRRLTDVESLKAIAHPLRVRLLGALRIDGPATATELARRFAETSGATSYHLRQLARFGFIEEDPEQPNQRDRRWRAAHEMTSWRESDFADDPEGREAINWMRERQIQVAARHVRTFQRSRDSWSPQWRDAAGQHDQIVRLTPAALHELTAKLEEIVDEYSLRCADDPAAERVAIFLSATPFREYPMEETP